MNGGATYQDDLVDLDPDRCLRMCRSGDPRFDGWFFVGVTSTHIYCRPSCPSRPPRADRMRYYPSAASAQSAGFRACKRCRPDASPGSPEWDLRADLSARAMRLIGDGVVDREGVAGMAARLGYSERHLHRLLVAELGVGPQALARAQRAQSARLLIETTDLPFTDVAFAAGFASVRQFNDTVREVFADNPTHLRAVARRRRGSTPIRPGWVSVRLAHRQPFDAAAAFSFLVTRAVPGVEEPTDAGGLRRALTLPGGSAVVELEPADGHVWCRLRLDDVADLGAAVHRCRRLLDLDADPVAADEVLAANGLARAVRLHPGLRVPGTVDPHELVCRAVAGQQVSLASARRALGLITATVGSRLEHPVAGVTHTFPSAEQVAAIAPAGARMPRRRAVALTGIAAALADGSLVVDAGSDREAATAALLARPGIGPWTAAYVAMRALGSPDAWLPGDVGVRAGLEALGLRAGLDLQAAPERWRPWRSYAVMHLWAAAAQVDSSKEQPDTRKGSRS
ncbi:MAG TPA: AlkA N-terminal domain-containing protein [Microthrixaceae bacterium]|nr:AlkA N-terminal domain-containing protein [Microthrixaceae bacterium]